MQSTKVKEYETIYILRSDVDADAAEKIQNRVADVITREQGKLVKVESWGRRKLAYPVGKSQRGVYMYVKYFGGGGLVAELERNLKFADDVVKYQSVLLKKNVDLAAVDVNPEEVKMQRIELPAEEEEQESRERALGLLDPLPEARRHDDDDEYGDDELGDDEGIEA